MSYDLIVGTFNSPRLYTLRLTTPSSPSKGNGKLEVLQQHSAIGSHSWLHLSSSKRNLYATAWTEPPTVAAYAIESPTSIKLLNTAATNSRSGYVCASETHAYSAGGATGEVFELDSKTGAFTAGEISPKSGHVNGVNGVNGHKTESIPSAQKLDFVSDTVQQDDGSTMDFGGLRHGAHSADLSPDGKALYIADIGRNCIWTYAINSDPSATPNLTLGEKHISPRSHDGPRHVHPHPTGKYVYCLQEHSSMVDVFETSENGTKLKHVQGVRIIPKGLPVNEFWADEVRTSLANGSAPQYLYASTRGLKEGRKGFVAVYRLTPDGLIDGAEIVQQDATGEPRDDDMTGLAAMYETATSGGWANAVEPGPNVDGVEYLALTDSEVGYVFVLGWNADQNEMTEVARVNLTEVANSGSMEGAATAVWL